MDIAAVTIRLEAPGDAAEIERVAQRDSAPAPPPPRLLAFRDGRIDAALSLRTGAIVADPFERTAELVELLGVRAREVTGRTGRDGLGAPASGPLSPRPLGAGGRA